MSNNYSMRDVDFDSSPEGRKLQKAITEGF